MGENFKRFQKLGQRLRNSNVDCLKKGISGHAGQAEEKEEKNVKTEEGKNTKQ